MTPPPPLYDLVLLLDTSVEESARRKALADARALIAAQGEEVRHDEWGDRPLAYPIAHRGDAEYHLVQFHGPPSLLAELQRTLRIADPVARFRIIKLAPGTPEPPSDMRSSAAPRRSEAEAAAATA